MPIASIIARLRYSAVRTITSVAGLRIVRGAELARIGFVGRRRCHGQCESIINADLRVIGKALVQPLHRLLVPLNAGAVGRWILIAVKLREAGNEAGLALAFGADPPRLLKERAPFLKV